MMQAIYQYIRAYITSKYICLLTLTLTLTLALIEYSFIMGRPWRVFTGYSELVSLVSVSGCDTMSYLDHTCYNFTQRCSLEQLATLSKRLAPIRIRKLKLPTVKVTLTLTLTLTTAII